MVYLTGKEFRGMKYKVQKPKVRAKVTDQKGEL